MTSVQAKFIQYSVNSGESNMEIDEMLLDEAIENSLPPVLRLYGWDSPTLSLGRNQKPTGIDFDFCKAQNIPIVRRPTGGRAVYHDCDLTYSFVVRQDLLKCAPTVKASYTEISEALVMAFNSLGVALAYPEDKTLSVDGGYCMQVSTGADLSYNDKKLIGSAQLRKKGYILQHGSIIISLNKDILTGIFKDAGALDNVTSLQSISKELCDIEVLACAIKSGFEQKFSLGFIQHD